MLSFSCRTKGQSDLPVSRGSCRTGWSRALRWGRILRTSLIHVLLDKSIRSAWINLSISPVHCHGALWSSLSCRDGTAPSREGWRGTGVSWTTARLFPGSELHWGAQTGLHGLGKNRAKEQPAGKLHHLKSNHHCSGYPDLKLPKQCPLHPPPRHGAAFLLSKITSSLKRGCN